MPACDALTAGVLHKALDYSPPGAAIPRLSPPMPHFRLRLTGRAGPFLIGEDHAVACLIQPVKAARLGDIAQIVTRADAITLALFRRRLLLRLLLFRLIAFLLQGIEQAPGLLQVLIGTLRIRRRLLPGDEGRDAGAGPVAELHRAAGIGAFVDLATGAHAA
jgi:hypothetical protein